MRRIGTFRVAGFVIVTSSIALGLLSERALGQINAPRYNETKRVRALLVTDLYTQPPLPGLTENRSRMKGLLDWTNTEVSRNNVTITEFPTVPFGSVTPRQVLDFFNNLQDVTRDDVLLFYYAGHGATDPTRGQWLALSGGGLARSDLRAAMQAKNPGLVVIISDCCSNTIPLVQQVVAMAAPLAQDPSDLARVLRDLLFRHTGTVDFTAATYDATTRQGEYAWYTSTDGGIFTESLWNLLVNGPGFAGQNAPPAAGAPAGVPQAITWGQRYPGDTVISWNDVVSLLGTAMERRYASIRNPYVNADPATLDPGQMVLRSQLLNQPRQRPQAFSLGTIAPAVAAVPPGVPSTPGTTPTNPGTPASSSSTAPSTLTPTSAVPPVAPPPVAPMPVGPASGRP